MAEWTLCVDESGPFDGKNASILVGLLYRLPDAIEVRRGLRRVICDAMPHAPYPHHAAHANRKSFHLTLAMGAGEANLPVRTVAYMSAQHPEALARVLDAHRDGEVSPLRDYFELDSALESRSRSRWAARRRSEYRQGMSRAMGMLCAAAGHAVLLPGVAVEGYSTGGVLGALRLDPWTASLGALFRRVLALVAGERDPATIMVNVSNRRAYDVDQKGQVDLTGSVLRKAVNAALHGVPRRSDVQWEFPHRALPYFTRDVHPGIVLADFLSNRMNRRVSHKRPWERLRDALLSGGALGLGDSHAHVCWAPPWAPGLLLPTLESLTDPASRTHAAMLRREFTTSEGEGWWVEQANSWVHAMADREGW